MNPRFHLLMAEMSGTIFDAALVDVVLSLVYGFPEHLRSGADVADFDCGSGHAINVLVRAFSASRFTGIDFFDEAIAIHTTEVARLSLGNVTVESHNLVRLDRAAAYNVIIVFDTIHDQTQPVRMLENDLSHPATRRCDPNGQHQGVKPARRQCRCLDEHLTVYGLTDALQGAGLDAVWGRQLATTMLGDVGFDDVRVVEIESDPINNYYIATKLFYLT